MRIQPLHTFYSISLFSIFFVGILSYSYAHGYTMQENAYDNVKAILVSKDSKMRDKIFKEWDDSPDIRIMLKLADLILDKNSDVSYSASARLGKMAVKRQNSIVLKIVRYEGKMAITDVDLEINKLGSKLTKQIFDGNRIDDYRTNMNIVSVLGKLKYKKSADRIRKILNSTEETWWGKFLISRALVALGQIKDVKAVADIEQFKDSDDKDLKSDALRALKAIREPHKPAYLGLSKILHKDEIWQGEIILRKHLEIPRNIKLIIKPGTTIQAEKDAMIKVSGTLIACGGEAGITFKGYFNSIKFIDNNSSGTLKNCIIESKGIVAAIICKGASPVIRENTIIIRGYGSPAAVYCDDKASPIIEGNKIRFGRKKAGGTSQSAIISNNSSPIIRGNTIENYKIGVHICEQSINYKPTIENNEIINGVLDVFDETYQGKCNLKQVFVSREIYRALSVEKERYKGRDILSIYAYASPMSTTTEIYRLSYQKKKYLLEHSSIKYKKEFETSFQNKKDQKIKLKCCKKASLFKITSGLGIMRLEGCQDTSPSFLLFLYKKGQKNTVVWRSPKFDRGVIVPAVLNLDGKKRPELVICTGRWCEGKGRIFVFQEAVK